MKRKIRCAGEPMTAIVLAGGRGRRMKADKAGLDVGGRTLLEHVLAQIEPYFDEVLVSLSPGQSLRFGERRAQATLRIGRGRNARARTSRRHTGRIEGRAARGLRHRRLRYPRDRRAAPALARPSGAGRGHRRPGRSGGPSRTALRRLQEIRRPGDRGAPGPRRTERPAAFREMPDVGRPVRRRRKDPQPQHPGRLRVLPALGRGTADEAVEVEPAGDLPR
ncbi:MAG: NTP transferase domain-containing protein [Candidatus Moduliflexus flocculans]|nr:NTP transferase domain-containing protein [Candidatus Moduliflexus flocculans]